MPVIGGAKGLIDLPGFDRIASVASAHKESARLRGSTARRLVQHLLAQRDVDHTLPAVCSPPPSDVDLLFSSDDSERIVAMLRDIRDSAPIFQAIRVEASSMPRIQALADEVDSYIDCPVLGVSMGDFDEEGFEDSTGRGIQQLADRRLTFHYRPGAYDESIDPDVRFHLYCAGLVFAKAAYEHGSRDDFLGSEAREYCRAHVRLAQSLATPPAPQVTDDTPYYRARLYGIAFSLRAILPPVDFGQHILPLLPRRIARVVGGSHPFAPLFNLAKSNVYEPEERWQPTQGEWVHDNVDLTHAEPLLTSPPVALAGDMIDSCFLECLIPVPRQGETAAAVSAMRSAAIELTVRSGEDSETIWLPASCAGHVRTYPGTRAAVASLRIALDQAAGIVSRAGDLLGEAEGEAVIHILGRKAEEEGDETTLAAPPVEPDEEEEDELELEVGQEAPRRAVQYEVEM